jgi:hypothetical protein
MWQIILQFSQLSEVITQFISWGIDFQCGRVHWASCGLLGHEHIDPASSDQWDNAEDFVRTGYEPDF